jgi:exosortase family protein XrtF
MKSNFTIAKYRPALLFLIVFVGWYVAANVLYGLYVEYYDPAPDPATVWVTHQTTWILNFFGEGVIARAGVNEPTMLIISGANDGVEKTVLRVFEGCNGINVMIVFVAFVSAFGGRKKMIPWFVIAGVGVIHVANLLRILFLYATAIHRPILFYYFHKYFFTAVLYIIVLALWAAWMKINSQKHADAQT